MVIERMLWLTLVVVGD